MQPINYIPTNAVPALRKKKKPRGITFPMVTTPDTGIIMKRSLSPEPRYQLWYRVDGIRQYLMLPKGITIEEARTRRDNFFKNLKERHRAKARKHSPQPRKPPTATVRDGTYIYERPGFVVRILGKQIGAAYTREEALAIRDKWIAANPDKVPHVLMGKEAA